MKSDKTLLLEAVENLLGRYRRLHQAHTGVHVIENCLDCLTINKAQKLYDRITRSNAKGIDHVSKILEELNK